MVFEALQLALALRWEEGGVGMSCLIHFINKFLDLWLRTPQCLEERGNPWEDSALLLPCFNVLNLSDITEFMLFRTLESPCLIPRRPDFENTWYTMESSYRCSGLPFQQVVIASQTGACSHLFCLGSIGRGGRFPSLMWAITLAILLPLYGNVPVRTWS